MTKELCIRSSIKKDELIFIRIGVLIVVAVILPSIKVETRGELWFDIILNGFFVISLGICELEYHLKKLQLSPTACCYTNLIGRKYNFQLSEIDIVYPQADIFGENEYIMAGKDGKQYVKIKGKMQNAENLLPFLIELKEKGLWNGQLQKEYEHLRKSKKAKRNHIPEVLIVKPGKFYFLSVALITVIFVGMPLVLLVSGIVSMCNGNLIDGGWIFGVALFLLLGCTIWMLLVWHETLRTYTNVSLVLTKDLCKITDKNGKIKEFFFDDIEDVNRVVQGRGRYRISLIHIKLKTTDEVLKFKYDERIKNCKKIQEFIAYHKKMRILS